MAQTVSLRLSAHIARIWKGASRDRGRPVKHVQRAQIVLLSAERLPVLEIANRVGVSRPMVWRWQQRFAEEGIEGLLRDKTRPPGIPPVPQAKVHAVVERTLREPPGAVTHWTGRAMARAMGLSLRTIQRIWVAHKLQPHRIKTFKRSNDPARVRSRFKLTYGRRQRRLHPYPACVGRGLKRTKTILVNGFVAPFGVRFVPRIFRD